MKKTNILVAAFGLGVIVLAGAIFAGAQEQNPVDLENHTDCAFFGAGAEKRSKELRDRYWRSRITQQIMSTGVAEGQIQNLVPSGSRTQQLQGQASDNPIDVAILSELQRRGIPPAEQTTDLEFLRRVTLDVTGRIPTYESLVQFNGTASPTKRAELIEQLLSSPEYVDKWTMYFGDMFRNTRNGDVLVRGDQGRNAFYNWIKSSMQANKSYKQMATELIANKGTNSFEQGEVNFLLGSKTQGGPINDDYDQETADVAATFLGVAHMNCILCHNGRGHLDTLSLWGKNAKRSDAWATSAYFAKTNMVATYPDRANLPNFRYYSLVDVVRADYPLNTTTGNRPARQPTDGLGTTVPPKYIFGGDKPKANESYREAFARAMTSDFQFSRATVNYMWGALMGRGLVEPLDQFDPARLDPDNPPTGSWGLQPSNAALLNTLADGFIKSNYDLKWLMRIILNSDTYQMSSRYAGEWNVTYEPLFARHLVRRLWAEEIHDAISISSNILPTYNVPEYGGAMYTDRTNRTVRFAMQLPETGTLPDNNLVASFLNSFGRGDRLSEDRKSDGSAIQALNLMNDIFVTTRIRSSNVGGQQSILNRYINVSDGQLVNQFYMNVLSRYPNQQEMDIASATLKGTTGTLRVQKGENLLWTLYNKVDFIYNY